VLGCVRQVIGVVSVAGTTGGFARVLWRCALASETKGCHGLARNLDVVSREGEQAADEKLHIAHQCVDGTVVGRLTSGWLIGPGLVKFRLNILLN